MKHIIAAVAAVILTLALAACSSASYTMLYYETAERQNAALSFSMRDVPGLNDVAERGAADGKLGETSYTVHDTENEKGDATLIFRMAELDYADKYARNNDTPGIAGIAAGDPVKSERLGSANITYYAADATVFAVWELGDFAYSAALTFTDSDVAAEPDDVYPYVLSLIAS